MELGEEATGSTRHASQYTVTSPATVMDEDTQPVLDSSPVVEQEMKRTLEHDSLVTVRLSEPPSLETERNTGTSPVASRTSIQGEDYGDVELGTGQQGKEENATQVSESQDMGNTDHVGNLQDELEADDGVGMLIDTMDDTAMDLGDVDDDSASDMAGSRSSEDTNWDQLQKIEDEESRDQDNSTAMLLARLEQENNLLATNPKTVKVQHVEKQEVPKQKTRPPSMAQLRQMVDGPHPPALRYSVLPPPPMTDLQFYAALVKDYYQTAARLPTLLTNKIRKGIPPPLRGIVWQSMCNAQDQSLHQAFDKLSGESSPYEGIIGKDLGRSFPGVDMFRDPDGEGQRSLGRVLKCFSLYDQKIGYCQGLAFLVGPLLMHMSAKEAFCVLVRLMENYDLRDCFLPDLAGLHVRIYQFRELLRQHLPILSAHLEDLQVDLAYVSQWFLSFFAVTCPLPMLFRIYDVIFAEGASETIMRVALSVMHKNEDRILACTELENVVQLLLSRSLWGCYNYNADELVDDFVGFSDIVTRERLEVLTQGYRVSQLINSANTTPGTITKTADAARALDITTAASRFLGRIWATSSSSPKTGSFISSTAGVSSSSGASSSTLGPSLTVAASRPLSMLRRTVSKQSLASTLNSVEAGSTAPTSSAASVLSSASTESTLISRDSSGAGDISSRDSAPSLTAPKTTTASGASTAKDDDKRNLHSQIEDLLTALSELQRNHALLADQLQKEREERDEDRKAVRSLLVGLQRKAGTATASDDTDTDASSTGADELPTEERLSILFDNVEQRFGEGSDSRRSSIVETKSQLRDQLNRVKEQLANEVAKSQEYNRRIYEKEQEVSNITDQLKESRGHVRNLHHEKQRLEKQIHAMRVRASDTTPSSSSNEPGTWFSQATGIGGSSPTPVNGPGGLRELKLSRSKSTPSQPTTTTQNKRSSSLMLLKPANGSRESLALPSLPAPVNENDGLLLELVQAKTAEAIAKQEAEEAKQALEKLRKAFGLAPGDVGRLTGGLETLASMTVSQGNRPAIPVRAATSTPAPPANGGGGFWGWRR